MTDTEILDALEKHIPSSGIIVRHYYAANGKAYQAHLGATYAGGYTVREALQHVIENHEENVAERVAEELTR